MKLPPDIRELVVELMEYHDRVSETPVFHPLRDVRVKLLDWAVGEVTQWMIGVKLDQISYRGTKINRDVRNQLTIERTGLLAESA